MFKAGDRVAYSAAFCRSTGQMTGETPAARGTVLSVRADFPTTGLAMVEVAWDGYALPWRMLGANLALVGPNPRFCACD